MCQTDDVDDMEMTSGLAAAKRRVIHDAAISRFSALGFAGTSMADIADEAAMSRPALYQYFRNKGDIFVSAFVHLFEDQVERALLVLNEPGPVAEQLNGFLQRYEGDLWQRMATTMHSDEILSAKNADIVAAIDSVVMQLWDGMATYLARVAVGRSRAVVARRAAWIELLKFSPKGFKFDQPSVEVYRRRLSALAQSVAADIAAS